MSQNLMTLNHIHIGTKDLEKSTKFYESFFGFRKAFAHGEGVFLENDAGFLLAIDPVEEHATFPAWFHLGFCLSNAADVRSIYEKMNLQGVAFSKDFAEYSDEAAVFYCFDPDGFKIEVSWHKK